MYSFLVVVHMFYCFMGRLSESSSCMQGKVAFFEGSGQLWNLQRNRVPPTQLYQWGRQTVLSALWCCFFLFFCLVSTHWSSSPMVTLTCLDFNKLVRKPAKNIDNCSSIICIFYVRPAVLFVVLKIWLLTNYYATSYSFISAVPLLSHMQSA